MTARPAGPSGHALLLVRHGTAHNPDGLVYGRLPGFPLSPAGRCEAESAARALSAFGVDQVVSSPQDRALQTAAVIAVPHHRHVRRDVRLSEVLNQREGKPFVPEPSWAQASPGITLLRPHPFPGARETQEEIRQRMAGAAAIALERAEGDVVLVSHQVPLAILIRFLGVTADVVPDIGECDVIAIRFTGGRWRAGLLGKPTVTLDLPAFPDGLARHLRAHAAGPGDVTGR